MLLGTKRNKTAQGWVTSAYCDDFTEFLSGTRDVKLIIVLLLITDYRKGAIMGTAPFQGPFF